MKRDCLGDRMKDLEHRTKSALPRRCYTLIRLDGKSFHTYTKHCERPFDKAFRRAMQETARLLCAGIQGAKLAYTQSDEITILLTDFDSIHTEAWFDGEVQKIVSISASMATAFFAHEHNQGHGLALFDSRVWTTSDPWEAYNAFVWRQQDATRNAIQMVARSLASHGECHHKDQRELQELIHGRGQNFNDFPTDCKRGAFIVKTESGHWEVDREPPILTQDRAYFFSKVPSIPQFVP